MSGLIQQMTNPVETICMKRQILVSGVKKNISKCHLLKILPRVQSVNLQKARLQIILPDMKYNVTKFFPKRYVQEMTHLKAQNRTPYLSCTQEQSV